MLILPLDRRIDWKRPPLVTLLLVLVNVLVFVFGQWDDDARLMDAGEFYVGTELPAMELQDLRRSSGDRGLTADEVTTWDAVNMQFDDAFRRRLAAGEVMPVDDPRYPQWQEARSAFESRLDASLVVSGGFTPAVHAPPTLLTHMFLHGGLMHLIGNMVFLLLIGFVVEYTLGAARYLALYLLGGLAAVGLFWAVDAGSYVPLVGASGAISALMGAYSVLFGLRKIWFFYSVGIYFDYVKAPALWLLPVWVLYEVYQYFAFGDLSSVAYMAHAGGLLGGAAIAAVLRLLGQGVDNDYLEARERDETLAGAMRDAEAALAALAFPRARRALQPVVGRHADNAALHLLMFRAQADQPADEAYHAAAHAVLRLPRGDQAFEQAVARVWHDYRQRAKPKPRMTLLQAQQLCQRFQAAGLAEDAAQLLKGLLKAGAQAVLLPDLLLKQLVMSMQARDREASRQWFNALVSTFPDAEQTAQARRYVATPA